MPSYTKESLEVLRSRIDLVEVVSPHVKLQRAGHTHKGLCPFHEERSPSFIVDRSDQHYHCFGCGAHGDAIRFLMDHLKMTFTDAVEKLADTFHVTLELQEGQSEPKGPPKAALREALEIAAAFYHYALLHTLEGHAALEYLYARGLTLEFLTRFQFGLAPKAPGLSLKVFREHKLRDEILETAGLVSRGREFFADRIMIPIRDVSGAVIGFTARKYRDETFGPKYVNTPETPLFKKSRILFGLSESRKTIAKERKALIVEGQIDALRLIHAGFNWTVAGQGTAFGEEHAKELIQLGVRQVHLALDGDNAGQEAAVKIGHLFQKEGIEVLVVPLPGKTDPDVYLRERGPEEFRKLLETSPDYLAFLVAHHAKTLDMQSPAGKNELVQTIAKRIRSWDHPLMVHESLRRLAHLTQTPEAALAPTESAPPQVHLRRPGRIGEAHVDPDRILEADLLRWLLLGEGEPQLLPLAEANLQPTHFRCTVARALYQNFLSATKENKPRDLLSLAIGLDSAEAQLFLAEVLQKRVNRERILPHFVETIQRILDREWMIQREEVKLKIFAGQLPEPELLALARQFDELKRMRPQVHTSIG